MKKLYSIAMLVMFCLTGLSANAAKIDVTINADHADRVVVQSMPTGWLAIPEIVALENGSNSVSINCESTLKVITTDQEYVVESVTIDGVAADITDNHIVEVYIPMDTKTIDITTGLKGETPGPGGGDEPVVTEKYPVTFSFSDDHARAFVDRVIVADRPYDDWAAGFEVDANTYVTVSVDLAITDVKAYANGVEQSIDQLFSNFSYQVTSATEFRFVTEEVTPVETRYFTVDVDDASRIEAGYTVWNQFYPMTTYLSLKNGENKIEIPEAGMPNIFIRAKEGFQLDAVTVDGTQVADTESIPVTADMILSITTSEKTYNEEITVTVVCEYYDLISMVVNDSPVELKSARQDVTLTLNADTMIVISGRDEERPITQVKVNDTEIAGSGFGTLLTYFINDVKDGDVITVEVSSGTGIEMLESATAKSIYNLQGQKMHGKTLTPGIYIVNGKITIIK